MDFRHLRYFVTVAEELHFGRAAARLSITQPPLSQQIMALEQELGVSLFIRTRRSVELTPVAKQWLPDVRRVLANAAALPALARRLSSGEVGSLTLAFVSTADYGVLPDLMRLYGARHPEVRVNLREATSDVQIQALLNDEIDAGLIIPTEGVLKSSLCYSPIVHEPLILALPQSWIQERRIANANGKIRLRDVLDAPLIIFPRRSAPAFYDAITAYYAAHGATPCVGQEAVQMQTIVSLVSAGMGVALVPASLRHLQRTGVAYRDLRGAVPKIETGLVWQSQRKSPTLKNFIAAMHDLKVTSKH